MRFILTSCILLTLFACKTKKDVSVADLPLPAEKGLTDTQTTTCQLVEKSFTNKGGKITDYKELYLRCSIQDYFIKLCESKVTRKDLEPYIDKGITVKMEIRQGMWDHCDPNPAYAQSRTGIYVAILSIEK